MSRPALHGWILDNDNRDPLVDPAYIGTSLGGCSGIPFFTEREEAVRQCDKLNEMFPLDHHWVVTECTLTTRE